MCLVGHSKPWNVLLMVDLSIFHKFLCSTIGKQARKFSTFPPFIFKISLFALNNATLRTSISLLWTHGGVIGREVPIIPIKTTLFRLGRHHEHVNDEHDGEGGTTPVPCGTGRIIITVTVKDQPYSQRATTTTDSLGDTTHEVIRQILFLVFSAHANRCFFHTHRHG